MHVGWILRQIPVGSVLSAQGLPFWAAPCFSWSPSGWSSGGLRRTMSTTRIRIEPGDPATFPEGRIDIAKVDSTTEAEIGLAAARG